MTARLDPVAATPDLMKIWFDASRTIASSLDPILAELVKIRASQINGCAIAVDFGGFVDPTALRARAA